MIASACTAALLVLAGSSMAYAQEGDYSDVAAVIETPMGQLVIEFFPDDAPNHVDNFIMLAEAGFYDETLFHRIIPNFMIQAGDPNTVAGDPNTWGTGGPSHTVDAEFNDIKHDRGIVSMARSQNPNSAGSQFFIVHQNSNFLDGQYTVFGRLATESSFETLDRIAAVTTGMADRPVEPEQVRITTVSIVDRSGVSGAPVLPTPDRVESAISVMPGGEQHYESDDLGIAFTAPAGWLLQEPGRTNPIAPDVVAVGPVTDGTNPQIYVYVVGNEGQMSLDEIVTSRMADLQGSIDDETITQFSEKSGVVAGLPAHVLEATELITIGNRTVHVTFTEVLILGDENYYSLSYANIPMNFREELPKFEKVLESFVVLGLTDREEAAGQVESQQQLDEEQPELITTDQPTEAGDSGDGGGCLIATAAFGSEMAPQVQALRELRDNTVMATQSGQAFMSGFNTIYYSFSPAVADLEREHPEFQEMVRALITPMLASLSLLATVDIDSDAEMLAYGSAVILMNIGMYVAAPVAAFVLAGRTLYARRSRL